MFEEELKKLITKIEKEDKFVSIYRTNNITFAAIMNNGKSEIAKVINGLVAHPLGSPEIIDVFEEIIDASQTCMDILSELSSLKKEFGLVINTLNYIDEKIEEIDFATESMFKKDSVDTLIMQCEEHEDVVAVGIARRSPRERLVKRLGVYAALTRAYKRWKS